MSNQLRQRLIAISTTEYGCSTLPVVFVDARHGQIVQRYDNPQTGKTPSAR